MTTRCTPRRRQSGKDLSDILRWEFSELGTDELSDLTAAVRAELEFRVGEQLSAQLSENERDEFSVLVDSQDDENCAKWLHAHLPDYAAVVSAVTEALVAETVLHLEKVERADDSRQRQPCRRRIEPADQELLLRVLDFQQLQYSAEDEVAIVEVECESGSAIRVGLSVNDDGLFCARSTYPMSIPARRHPELLTFIHQWNVKTYFPKVFSINSADARSCTVVAETAIPLTPGVHGQLLDYLVTVALNATHRLFDELGCAAEEWHPTLL